MCLDHELTTLSESMKDKAFSIIIDWNMLTFIITSLRTIFFCVEPAVGKGEKMLKDDDDGKDVQELFKHNFLLLSRS